MLKKMFVSMVLMSTFLGKGADQDAAKHAVNVTLEISYKVGQRAIKAIEAQPTAALGFLCLEEINFDKAPIVAFDGTTMKKVGEIDFGQNRKIGIYKQKKDEQKFEVYYPKKNKQGKTDFSKMDDVD